MTNQLENDQFLHDQRYSAKRHLESTGIELDSIFRDQTLSFDS